MSFYNDVILPKLCDLAMRNKRLVPYRERVIGAAEGCVLEIGTGSGRNLPFYRPSAKQILALEPSPKLVAMARSVPHPGTPVSNIKVSIALLVALKYAPATVQTSSVFCLVAET